MNVEREEMGSASDSKNRTKNIKIIMYLNCVVHVYVVVLAVSHSYARETSSVPCVVHTIFIIIGKMLVYNHTPSVMSCSIQ